jgi:hypothetical protein
VFFLWHLFYFSVFVPLLQVPILFRLKNSIRLYGRIRLHHDERFGQTQVRTNQ